MHGEQEVERLSQLARVTIPEADRARFAKDFESIIAYVDTLSGLSVDLAEGRDGAAPAINMFRTDENPYPAGTHTDAIAQQFPTREGNLLSVKQIISHD